MNDDVIIKDFLEKLLKYLDVDYDISIQHLDDKICVDLITNKSASIIGYRGEVLDSIQALTGALVNKDKESYVRVVVNCEGYRQKREDTLIDLAKKKAVKAIKTGKSVSLEPMNAFERRIIHSALTDFANIRTESKGEEPNRYVVIIPENVKRFKEEKKVEKKSISSIGKKSSSSFGSYLGNSLKDDK